jgi:hypothetical protein
MGIYDGIEGVAPAGKGGQYFQPGKFKVEILAVKQVKSQAGGQIYFIVETKVLESDNPGIPPKAERSQVIDVHKKMGLPNIKAFVAAASGFDPSQADTVTEEVEVYWSKMIGEHLSFSKICELIVSDANPLAGIVMRLECVNVKTKEKKEDFTKHMWSPREQEAQAASTAS